MALQTKEAVCSALAVTVQPLLHRTRVQMIRQSLEAGRIFRHDIVHGMPRYQIASGIWHEEGTRANVLTKDLWAEELRHRRPLMKRIPWFPRHAGPGKKARTTLGI